VELEKTGVRVALLPAVRRVLEAEKEERLTGTATATVTLRWSEPPAPVAVRV
jgi:hypothetical protein